MTKRTKYILGMIVGQMVGWAIGMVLGLCGLVFAHKMGWI